MTPSRARAFALVLLSALCIASCSNKDNPVSTSGSTVLWPLAKGNQWDFQSYEYNSLTQQLEPSDVVSCLVLGDSTIQGTKWWLCSVPDTPFIGLLNRSDGLWALDEEGKDNLVLRYPGKVNDSWRVHTGRTLQDTIIVKLTATNTPVTDPAGTFLCMEYYLTNLAGDAALTWHIAPGKGLIRTQAEQRDTASGRSLVVAKSELKTYVLH
jgi:hypothetical protein